jgi:hypothetical protein
MTKRLVRIACMLALLAGSFAVTATAQSTAAPANTTATCFGGPPVQDAVYTNGDPTRTRWGWTQTVHSTACNHWGNVQLHNPLPSGYQANVTLTRYHYGVEADHRYCYVRAGGRSCHTEAILTTSCVWSYTTDTIIYRWSGSRWDPVAWGITPMSVECG